MPISGTCMMGRMRAGRVRGLATCVALLLLLPGGAAGAAEAPYRGRTLVEVIDDLRGLGLKIVYSSALVHPDMLVSREPAAQEPRAVLAVGHITRERAGTVVE